MSKYSHIRHSKKAPVTALNPSRCAGFQPAISPAFSRQTVRSHRKSGIYAATFNPLLPVLLALVFSGCASGPAPGPKPQPPATSPQAEAAPTPPPAQTPPPRPGVNDILKAASAKPLVPFEGEGWKYLFNGLSLEGWRVTPFAGHAEVEIQSELLVLNMGDPFTGVSYTNTFPNMNYEIAFDAMRVMGTDFFCGLTVPVEDTCCSLIVGGWGGSLVGISSVDGLDASENETMKFVHFETGRWYRIRLRVTEQRIEGWIDQEKLIDLDTEGRKLSVRPGDIELSQPFGIASWQTTAALREIRYHEVSQPADPKRRRRDL